MARYRATDKSERRTEKLTVQLAPSERAELDAAAARHGAPVSTYARAMLFRGSEAAVTRRNPDAVGLMRELNAIGNNLNQIARGVNTSGQLHDDELRQALESLKPAIGKVLDL
jgi:hypothetical protein